MKKESLAFLCTACVLAATSSLCSKKNENFCSIYRTVADTVVERNGTVSYFDKYNRFTISLDSAIVNNIDNSYTGLVCHLPIHLMIQGTRVTVTGVLKNFNAEENIRPVLGGQEVYYLEILSIKKSE